MKTIGIALAGNRGNEVYKRKYYWLVLNAPIVAGFNAPDDMRHPAGVFSGEFWHRKVSGERPF